jgi:archaellum component FlaC
MSAPDRLRLRPPVTGPAKLIAFPLATRVHQIEKLATRIKQVTRERGEYELARELNVIRQRMAKQGFAPEQVAEQVAALEGRVRAELWDAVILGEGTMP